MKWDDIKLLADENGDDYLQFEERDTKTRIGGNQNGSRAFAPKIFPNKADPERCPVMFFQGVRETTATIYEERRKPLLSGH